jgi:peptidoglycan/LPS O-acetylase OafA/YrhL
MNKSLFEGSRGDRTSMLIALLCFVHCVAGPVLLSVAGFASLIGISEKLEPLFLAGSAAMGVVALLPAYRKKHGRISCLALFAFGFLCLLLRHYIELRAIPVEPIVVALGAGLIIAAHANLRFSRRCRCCDPCRESVLEEAR